MIDIIEAYAEQNDRLRAQVKRLKKEKKLLIERAGITCDQQHVYPPPYKTCLTVGSCSRCVNAWLRRKIKEGGE